MSDMNKTLPAMFALGVATLTSCVYNPYYDAYGAPPPYNRPGLRSQVHEDGYRDGQHDSRNGSAYAQDCQYAYAPRLRGEYLAGYDTGYSNPDEGYDSSRNYYRVGFGAVRHDHRDSLSYSAWRHYLDVPKHARDDFSLGYSEGWASWR